MAKAADALAYLGAERGLERVPSEAESEHRHRLRGAWGIWQLAGSAQGHLDAVGWTGLQNIKLYRRAALANPAPAGSPYVQSFARQVWASFDLVIQKPHPWSQKVWGSGWTYGDGTVWGSTATYDEVNRLKRFVRQFKSAHSTCVYIHVALGQGAMWGTFKYGDGTVYGYSGGGIQHWIVGEAHWASRSLV